MTLAQLIDRAASWWLNWRTDRAITGAIKSGRMEDLELKKFSATGKSVELLAMHPAIATIAEQAVSFLQVHNAENYVQFDLMPRIDRGTRPIRFTVQWASGLSPAEKARKLAEQLADLRSRATVDKITEYAGLLAYRDGNDQCSIHELAEWIETGKGNEWLTGEAL